jgi:hypothetical protein
MSPWMGMGPQEIMNLSMLMNPATMALNVLPAAMKPKTLQENPTVQQMSQVNPWSKMAEDQQKQGGNY